MKLMILDGNSIINRAFYGVGHLSNRQGQPTGAIYGFLNIMQSLLDEENPDALAVAFDEKAPTFRHLTFQNYKANRKPMPEDLASQLPLLKEILSAMHIKMYSLPGWEADDILGTAGKICGDMGWDCVIVTGDRDSLQLVDDHVTVKLITTRGGKTGSVNYTPEVFQEEYGFPPKGLIDLKALMGDSSDNYPGVPGIGEKTAKDLMKQFGSLEQVYAHAQEDSLKPAVRRKLAEGRDSAYQSYDLATIRQDAPVDFVPESTCLTCWDKPRVLELFRSLDFGRLIDKYRLLEDETILQEQTPSLNAQVITPENMEDFLSRYARQNQVYLWVNDTLSAFEVFFEETAWYTSEIELGMMEWVGFLDKIFAPEIQKVAHDVKSTMTCLARQGYSRDGFLYDTALAAYLLEPNRSKYDLEELCQEYCHKSFLNAPGGKAAAIAALYEILPELVQKNGMEQVYREIDFPLCEVLSEMETTGILLDRDTLVAFQQMLSQRIADCEGLIYGYAQGAFNINSTKQLGTLLFETLGLPHGKKTKSGYSTSIEVLETIRDKHPIVPAIIDYRMLTKLRSTYAEGLLKVINSDGRVRTTFQNMVTATGRLSSTDPNLQNIPVRTELGAEIRKMFVAQPGWSLVDADYSQIELRVLSHIAKDSAMQEAFRSGEDFHTITAARVFGIPQQEVTPQMRRSAKAVNFGIVYGISDFSLAGDIGVSRKEARAYIDEYLSHYQGVKAYMTDIVEFGREKGYVETSYGRRRQLPDLKSSNYNVRTGAERMALNTPIQGTAADIIKIAMIRVHDSLKRLGLQARLVLQVHDELIVECPDDEVAQVMEVITREMETAATLAVPLFAEAHAGKNWAETK